MQFNLAPIYKYVVKVPPVVFFLITCNRSEPTQSGIYILKVFLRRDCLILAFPKWYDDGCPSIQPIDIPFWIYQSLKSIPDILEFAI